jgi:5-methylcytosine-specific restriction endonuclease McrA
MGWCQIINNLPGVNSIPEILESNSLPSNRKTKKRNIPKRIKALVWKKYVGEDVATVKCFCCAFATVNMMEYDCGHIIAESKGGKMEIDNLRTICHECNLSMGSMSMVEF